MAISNNSTGLRPGVCTSTTRPTAPYEGQHIYETDTDIEYVWNGSAWVVNYVSAASPAFTGTPTAPTATAGTNTTQLATTAFVTAGINTLGAYSAYTPAFGGFTLGNGTVSTRWTQVNKQVHYYGRVVLGSTSAFTAALDITVPININTASVVLDTIGTCGAYNGSILFYGAPINLFSNQIRCTFFTASGTYVSNTDCSATVPFTWANGNIFFWNITYESV
jgi:hypothetical protein